MSKVMQYLQLRCVVDTGSHTPNAYLQAVDAWWQRQAMAQLRTRWHWVVMEPGRYQVEGAEGSQRAECACQRCNCGAMEDEEHLIFDCSASRNHRWNHSSLFTRGSRSLSNFMVQDETGSFC